MKKLSNAYLIALLIIAFVVMELAIQALPKEQAIGMTPKGELIYPRNNPIITNWLNGVWFK
jgi:hypothetical protein